MKPISPMHKKLGNRIRELRQERKMSQEDLAFAMKIDRSYMGFIERGERNPTFGRIVDLASTLKVSLSELFKNIS